MDDPDAYYSGSESGGHRAVTAGVAGTVWEIKAHVGKEVKAGDTLVSPRHQPFALRSLHSCRWKSL